VVEPGPLMNGLRIIRSGITGGDRVVIEGVQRAKPGLKVTIKPGRIAPEPADTAPSPSDDLSTPASTATAADVAN
jgi:hypothetical protein